MIDIRKMTGMHYTPNVLANFVAKVIVNQLENYTESCSLEILDPASGDGELLLALVKKMQDYKYYNLSY